MVIYTASELASKRVEVINTAVNDGRARIRISEGEELVMLPEKRLADLEKNRLWSLRLERLRRLLAANRRPTVAELGDLAWLRVFDNEDLTSFCDDISDQLIACDADENYSELDATIKDWKTTAGQLEDPLRKKILLQDTVDSKDFAEVSIPSADKHKDDNQ
ncbi:MULTISPECIES: hypothetical protein [Bifidobacterium]|uniref:hypothetical protein n=1 Tax=Bifidobacterium TaxID=1678 RepID=UPI001039CF08|nr:hypothetical protein [Bifidobacterium longum]TCE47754.1 hypothetical protein MCC10047_1909 [Bifidobacterium longum subsp. longum]